MTWYWAGALIFVLFAVDSFASGGFWAGVSYLGGTLMLWRWGPEFDR